MIERSVTSRGWIGILIVLLWVAGVAYLPGRAKAGPATRAAQASLQVIEPNGVGDTLAEIDEFASVQIGDPWDMEQQADLQQFRTLDSLFTNERFEEGIFYGNMTVGDGREYVMPLYAGPPYHDAIRTGRIGYTYPIDADRYHYLTFRMYSNGPNCHTGVIFWSEDDVRSEQSAAISNGFFVPPKPDCEGKPPGWYDYTYDLKLIGRQWGNKDWSGVVRELRIIPVGGVPVGTEIRMDWIRLTAQNPSTARPYTIRWQGGNETVAIYASRGDRVLDGNDILVALSSAGAGQATWQTGLVEAGTYYIYITDGTSSVWSPGALVLNRPSAVAIDAPSMSSGPEYSAIEIGNPWDMSDAADVTTNPPPPWNICMDQISFQSGIFNARTPRCPDYMDFNDPMIFLGGMDPNPPGVPDPEVDTQRYHYLSFHYYMKGEQTMPGGWIARFFWWKMSAEDNAVIELPTTGRAIVIHEGWNTYSVNLTASDVIDKGDLTGIPWLQAHPNRLRLDPNELLAQYSPGYVHFDWIKLAAVDEVSQGQPYTIRFTSSKAPITYHVYYDTDRNPGNGRTPVQAYRGDDPPPDGFRVVLPVVYRSDAGVGPRSYTLTWDTSDVPLGQYWISVDADDGYNSTTWYSEAPINVK